MSSEEFTEKTSKYFDDYFKTLGLSDEKPIVLEQLFSFSSPQEGMEYFNSAKCILVTRDPRDVFAASKYKNTDKSASRFMPINGDVKTFVKYYQCLYENISESENVIIVSFEDLIYKYDETKKKIAEFLNISDVSSFGSKFHPEISVKNTAFYKKVENIDDEIKYITDNLSQYLNHQID
jgi:hypothetical protein